MIVLKMFQNISEILWRQDINLSIEQENLFQSAQRIGKINFAQTCLC